MSAPSGGHKFPADHWAAFVKAVHSRLDPTLGEMGVAATKLLGAVQGLHTMLPQSLTHLL